MALEVPDTAPRTEILPVATEALEAVPEIARIAATLPVATETAAALPAMTSGAGPAIISPPEPWLTVALVAEMTIVSLTVPAPDDAPADEPDIGPPDSQPVPLDAVADDPVTAPISTVDPFALLTDAELPEMTPRAEMVPLA